MIDEGHAVRAVRAKLDRTLAHLEHLDGEYGPWTDRHPYSIVKQAQPKPQVWEYGIRFTEPVPVEWGVILGEAIHNLRSALDHCVYLLTVARLGRKPNYKTGLPIYKTEREFIDKGGQRQIAELTNTAQTYIKTLQPYPRRDARLNRDLLSLNMLWNQDKHRLVEPWGLKFISDSLRELIVIPPYKRIRISDAVLHDDAKAFTLWFDADPGQVNVSGYLAFQIAFEDPAERQAPKDRELRSLHRSSVEIVDHLLSLLPEHHAARPLRSTVKG